MKRITANIPRSIDELKEATVSMSEMDKIGLASKFVYEWVKYTDDEIVYKKPDYWATYAQIKSKLMDDCDGKAVALWHILIKELDVPECKLRLVVLNKGTMWHMAVLYYAEANNGRSGIYLVDPTWNWFIAVENEMNFWKPIASFNLTTEWFHADDWSEVAHG